MMQQQAQAQPALVARVWPASSAACSWVAASATCGRHERGCAPWRTQWAHILTMRMAAEMRMRMVPALMSAQRQHSCRLGKQERCRHRHQCCMLSLCSRPTEACEDLPVGGSGRFTVTPPSGMRLQQHLQDTRLQQQRKQRLGQPMAFLKQAQAHARSVRLQLATLLGAPPTVGAVPQRLLLGAVPQLLPWRPRQRPAARLHTASLLRQQQQMFRRHRRCRGHQRHCT